MLCQASAVAGFIETALSEAPGGVRVRLRIEAITSGEGCH